MSTSSSNHAPPTNETPRHQKEGVEGFSSLASKAPTRHPEEPPHHPTGAEIEADLISQGKMPGLAERQQHQQEGEDDGVNTRKPGEEDAAGNKIHHKGVLGHVLHWEHNSSNSDA